MNSVVAGRFSLKTTEITKDDRTEHTGALLHRRVDGTDRTIPSTAIKISQEHGVQSFDSCSIPGCRHRRQVSQARSATSVFTGTGLPEMC